MKYLLLIHQGDTPTPQRKRGPASRRTSRTRSTPTTRRSTRPPASPRASGWNRRDRDDRPRGGRQDADDRRAVRRRQGGARRLPRVRGRRPRRRDRARVARSRRPAWAAPSRCARSRSGSDPRAGLPRRVGPRPRQPDRLPRRLRPRRGSRPGGVRDRRRALAPRGDAGEPARLAGDDRAQPRDRPHPPRPHARREDPPARRAGGRWRTTWTRRRSRTSGSSSSSRAAIRRSRSTRQVALTLRTLGGLTRRRSPAPSSSPRRRWPSGSCARSARSRPPGSRSASRRPICSPTASPPCSPSST